MLLAVVVVGVVILAALAASVLMTGRFRIATDVADSTVAIMAADAATEEALYAIRRLGSLGPFDGCGASWLPLSNGATYCYQYEVLSPPGSSAYCPGSSVAICIRGFGEFRGVRRAFEVSF